MEIINFDNSPSLVSQYLTELRDIKVQNDMLRFRRNLERIGQIMAYEISKCIRYKTVTIDTPLDKCDCRVIEDNIVLATILRAGIPFHQGFLDYFDSAENAFVSAYRKYKEKENFDVFIEYIASHGNIYGTQLPRPSEQRDSGADPSRLSHRLPESGGLYRRPFSG